jgi:hypothetical protein
MRLHGQSPPSVIVLGVRFLGSALASHAARPPVDVEPTTASVMVEMHARHMACSPFTGCRTAGPQIDIAFRGPMVEGAGDDPAQAVVERRAPVLRRDTVMMTILAGILLALFLAAPAWSP